MVMNKEEKIYMFNEYVLAYDKGNDDRSCLTISKIISGDMYVIGSLFDGSAEIISLMLDNLQQENNQLKEIEKEHKRINGELREENEELKDNWKMLKEFLNLKSEPYSDYDDYDIKRILNKMQELEGSDCNGNN